LVTERDETMEESVLEMDQEQGEVDGQEEPGIDYVEALEQLERDKAQLAQQLLRLKADFDNFRRRTQAQMEDITRDASKQLLEDLLPVLDNFERALASDSDAQSNPFLQGMEMVYQGLMTTLASHGLQPILAKGQPFDPGLHEAVAMAGDQGDTDLIVLEEIQTGYLLNERVLRHTRVLVGPNKEEDECQK